MLTQMKRIRRLYISGDVSDGLVRTPQGIRILMDIPEDWLARGPTFKECKLPDTDFEFTVDRRNLTSDLSSWPRIIVQIELNGKILRHSQFLPSETGSFGMTVGPFCQSCHKSGNLVTIDKSFGMYINIVNLSG